MKSSATRSLALLRTTTARSMPNAVAVAVIGRPSPTTNNRYLVASATADVGSHRLVCGATTATTTTSSSNTTATTPTSINKNNNPHPQIIRSKPAAAWSFSTAAAVRVDYDEDDAEEEELPRGTFTRHNYNNSIPAPPIVATSNRGMKQQQHSNIFRKLAAANTNNDPNFTRLLNNNNKKRATFPIINNHPPPAHHHHQQQQQPSECTCGFQTKKDVHNDNHEPLPPPLPQPVYSVHKRVLPSNLVGLSSPQGRRYLLESLANTTAESYWALTEQFVNQSDPAFCGVTTLLMVLNAMNIDPNVRWKGGWRFYGDETVLLQRCCLNTERIKRVGITMEQFMILGTCHGMRITMKRPFISNHQDDHHSGDHDNNDNLQQQHQQQNYTLDDFRADVRQTLDSRHNNDNKNGNAILVTSFSRAALQQTGDGHYSPIAAYHEESDHVLILDVARFKYAPYWVSVEDLYKAMEPLDEATQMPRGWYVMKPPATSTTTTEEMANTSTNSSEHRRPAHLVPQVHEAEPCPVGRIKVEFCPAKINTKINSHDDNNNIGEQQQQQAGKSPKELQ